ncbi:MAG: hypothetical protein ACI9KE_004398, partial [Polyangiales bacterium]
MLMAACVPYQSGGVFHTVEGSHRFECIDLHVASVPFRARSWVVVRYGFGNPCQRGAVIDLSAAQVRATHGDENVRLLAFDPRAELGPGELDGRSSGEERIAYEIPPALVGKRLHVCVMLDDVA